MDKLKIEYLPISELKAYVNNAKEHPAEQVEQIKKSIQEFGMNDPIAVWKDNEIIEGHGRLLACSELGGDYAIVPVIRLDHLTDEQRKAYALVHNKLTMNSDFNIDLLNLELEDIIDIDMSEFGFNFLDDEEDKATENPYTDAVNIPQYEPTGMAVNINELYDARKYRELIDEIENSGVSEEDKTFLKFAAARHIVFRYKEIAEYYAKADVEMQELMERSALVIIDVDDAIANGYAVLRETIEEVAFDE